MTSSFFLHFLELFSYFLLTYMTIGCIMYITNKGNSVNKRGTKMTMTFKWRNDKKMMVVEDVKCFETNYTLFGTTGYKVYYNDGTFNVYSDETWELVKVEQ